MAVFRPRLDLKAIKWQQLSGHGWVLPACRSTSSGGATAEAHEMLDRVVRNLALPTRGQHSSYPSTPWRERAAGGAFERSHRKSHWKVSTDIGCDFHFLDGVTHATNWLRTPALKALADEMDRAYLEVDLVASSAGARQPHRVARAAGLRRGTGDQTLLAAADQRFSNLPRRGDD